MTDRREKRRIFTVEKGEGGAQEIFEGGARTPPISRKAYSGRKPL